MVPPPLEPLQSFSVGRKMGPVKVWGCDSIYILLGLAEGLCVTLPLVPLISGRMLWKEAEGLQAIYKTEFPCFVFGFFQPALKPCMFQTTYEFEMFHHVFIICLKMGIVKISFALITWYYRASEHLFTLSRMCPWDVTSLSCAADAFRRKLLAWVAENRSLFTRLVLHYQL